MISVIVVMKLGIKYYDISYDYFRDLGFHIHYLGATNIIISHRKLNVELEIPLRNIYQNLFSHMI